MIYKNTAVYEPSEFAERIDPLAQKLAKEYWVSADFDPLEKKGVDVGRTILYGMAVEAYREHLMADPAIADKIATYKVEPNPQRGAIIPVNPDLLKVVDRDTAAISKVALPQDRIMHALGIGIVHDISLDEAMRVAATYYLDRAVDAA